MWNLWFHNFSKRLFQCWSSKQVWICSVQETAVMADLARAAGGPAGGGSGTWAACSDECGTPQGWSPPERPEGWRTLKTGKGVLPLQLERKEQGKRKTKINISWYPLFPCALNLKVLGLNAPAFSAVCISPKYRHWEAEIDPRFPSADKIYTFNLIFTPPEDLFYFINF